MATYQELAEGFADADLRLKIQVAMVIVASEIITGNDTSAPYDQTKHDLRVKWSSSVIDSTEKEAVPIQKLLLGVFNTASIATILASDTGTIATQVRNVVDEFATARYAGGI